MSSKLITRGVHLVRPRSPEQSFDSVYRVGDTVRVSGIYRAVHDDHRVSHEVTLVAGDAFPRCKKCGTTVTFELMIAATSDLTGLAFRVHLYEIPHPEPEDTLQIA